MGPLDASTSWSEDGLAGSRRFLDRVWRLFIDDHDQVRDRITKTANPDLDQIYNQTVKKVTANFEDLRFNTGISQLMVFINEAYKAKTLPLTYVEGFVKLLAPVAPHMMEEIWFKLGHRSSISYAPWPTYDADKLVAKKTQVAVQVNGKLRAKLDVKMDLAKDDLKALALANQHVHDFINGRAIVKVIVVPNKIVNIVIKK